MERDKPEAETYLGQEPSIAYKKLMRIVFPLFVAFTGLVYFLTLSPVPFPGDSANLMAVYSGLVPMISPAHGIWGRIVSWLAGFGTASLATRLNVFSLLVGLAASSLLFEMVAHAILARIESITASPKTAAVSSVAGGCAAALALAFSVPFWMASTHLQYQVFDLLLILAVMRLLCVYLEKDSAAALFASAFLFGLAAVESLGLVLFLPVFLFVVAGNFIRRHRVSALRLSGAVVSGILGFSSIFLVAHLFSLSHDITLRGYTSLESIVRSIAVDQYRALKEVFPSTGWLSLAFVVVVPWCAAMAIAPRALNENREWGIMVLHAAMTLAVMLSLGNAPHVSPWAVFRLTGALPLPLIAMTAMTAGYLVGYWYLIVANGGHVNIDGEKTFVHKGSIWMGCVFGLLSVAILPVSAAINSLEANGRNAAFAGKCVSEFIDSLDGRRWVLSDGLLDSHILLESSRTGKDVRVLSLPHGDNEVYLRHIMQIIDEDPDFRKYGEEEIAKLKNGASLGLLPFIQDWMEVDQGLIGRLAIVSAPDLIISAGRTVLPRKFFFVASDGRNPPEDAAFLEEHREFWDRMAHTLAKSRGTRDVLSLFRDNLRRQVGFVANNAGVLLEDMKMDEEAFRTYNTARALDPENVSALLNLAELLRRKDSQDFHPGERDAVIRSLDKMLKDLEGRRLPIWSLSRYYGYVRSPLLFVRLGWAWAASGQPGMALAGISRAEEVADTPETRLKSREAKADLIWRNNDIEGAETIYEEIVKEDPGNNRAMMQLARIQSRRGSLDKAREWLSKAKEAGADKTALAFEAAALDLASGRPADARVKLAEITDMQPSNLQAWGMLAISALQMEDYADIEKRIIPKMVSAAGTTDDYLVLVIRGQLLYQRDKDYAGARDAFERASILRPGITMLMEWILRLDFALDDKNAAEEHARQIMRTSRQNGLANYIMGSIMLHRGRIAEAEDYYRRSVGTIASPEALNDLAEVLRLMGNLEEAEQKIREAMSFAGEYYILWDTLGAILLDKGDRKGAEEAYIKAVGIVSKFAPGDRDLRVYMNYADFLVKEDRKIEARKIMGEIREYRSSLPAHEQKRFDAIMKSATPARGK